MSGWRIVPLPDTRLREAWPLVRLRYPDWTLDTWLGEAGTLMADERPAGLLAAETGTGYIYAVCGYVVDRAGVVGEELSLPIVASIRWRGFDDPLERLVDAVESIGRDRGCRRAVSRQRSRAGIAAFVLHLEQHPG